MRFINTVQKLILCKSDVAIYMLSSLIFYKQLSNKGYYMYIWNYVRI